MTITYADAHDLLEGVIAARSRYDGDALTARFGRDALITLDPFDPPLAGHLGLRAYLLQAAEAERHYDLVIERHWVSGDTILAAWHASWNRSADEAKVRQAGFLSADVGGDGCIERLKMWTVAREYLAGERSG